MYGAEGSVEAVAALERDETSEKLVTVGGEDDVKRKISKVC